MPCFGFKSEYSSKLRKDLSTVTMQFIARTLVHFRISGLSFSTNSFDMSSVPKSDNEIAIVNESFLHSDPHTKRCLHVRHHFDPKLIGSLFASQTTIRHDCTIVIFSSEADEGLHPE